MSRRRRPIPKTGLLLRPSSFFQAVIAFGYNAYYFACLGFFVNSVNPLAFAGVRSTEPLQSLWEFLYTSVGIVTTSGVGRIEARTVGGELLFAAESVLGLLFVVFLLSAFVSIHLQKDRDETENNS